jgi:hypothetical protein
LPQLHHRLIEIARTAAGEKLSEIAFHGLAKAALVEISAAGAQARYNARHIPIEDGEGLIEGDAKDRASRVLANAGE